MILSDLRIGTRLSLGFGLLIAMMFGMALFSGSRFAQLRDINQRLVERDWAKVEATHVVDVGTRSNARHTLELVLSTDAAEQARIRERIERNKQSIGQALSALERLIYVPEGRELLQQLKSARERYVASFSRVAQLVEAGQREQAVSLLQQDTLPALDALQAPIDRLGQLQQALARQGRRRCWPPATSRAG
jgi:methyl-accepting chemotaxis protein